MNEMTLCTDDDAAYNRNMQEVAMAKTRTDWMQSLFLVAFVYRFLESGKLLFRDGIRVFL
jgi:hypothetical protein